MKKNETKRGHITIVFSYPNVQAAWDFLYGIEKSAEEDPTAGVTLLTVDKDIDG